MTMLSESRIFKYNKYGNIIRHYHQYCDAAARRRRGCILHLASSKRKFELSFISTTTTSGIPYAAIHPGWKLTFDGTTLYPLSISTNWRDDVLNMILVEV